MNDDVGARAARPHRGWHERGYLPHFDAGAVVQTITFRLADSLPREVYEKAAVIASNGKERFYLVEKHLDMGLGKCLLKDPVNAEIVRGTLQHFDGERYRLLAWAIMPNHVHAMIEQIEGHSLTRVVQTWKSFSAHAINNAQLSGGSVWSHDYFDRFVRGADHFENARYYIENNPVKARLVQRAEDWPYSSSSRG